jgi:glycosyltransferase involved in cell wall biosynthesis
LETRLSVLHVITKLAVGGAGMNTMISCRDLAGDGFPSEIAAGPERAPEGDYFALARDWGVRVLEVPHLVRRISPIDDFLALLELTDIIRRGGYSIVHTHGSKARLLGRAAARLSGRSPAVVQTFHGWPFDSSMSLAARASCALMERMGFRLADASVVVTPEDIFKGVAWGVGKPHDYILIRSGVELERFSRRRGRRDEARALLGIPVECPLVGTVARLAPVKDPDAFLGVADLLMRDFPDCRFLIIGDGPMRPAVEKSILEKGIGGSVILAGNRSDVHMLLPGLDVFLLTSRSEGMPRVLLEALAAGVPGVSTDVGGVCELLTGSENGFIRPVGDLKGLAADVSGILSSQGLAERLLRNVDADLEPYSAGRMVADLRELYLWCKGGPHSGPSGMI